MVNCDGHHMHKYDDTPILWRKEDWVKVNCDGAVSNEGVLLVFVVVQFVTMTGSF